MQASELKSLLETGSWHRIPADENWQHYGWAKFRIARRWWKCVECGRRIEVGWPYMFFCGADEEGDYSMTDCIDCVLSLGIEPFGP